MKKYQIKSHDLGSVIYFVNYYALENNYNIMSNCSSQFLSSSNLIQSMMNNFVLRINDNMKYDSNNQKFKIAVIN